MLPAGQVRTSLTSRAERLRWTHPMADSDPKEAGIAGVIRQRHDELKKALKAGEALPAQLPLLPVSESEAVDGADGTDPAEGQGRRGPGRPAGSRNRRTQDWVDYILAKYPSPLEALASCYARSVDVLMAELKCSRLDAYKIQQAAAANLAPYIHQKQPMAMQIEGKGMVQLIIQGVDDDADLAGLDDESVVIEGTIAQADEGEAE